MSASDVTIRSLMAQHPALFYDQSWYMSEPFMDEPLREELPTPRDVRKMISDLQQVTVGIRDDLVSAVTLVAAYVNDPWVWVWADYLWTASCDREGQRIYVGGTANGHGFEIHRHLFLTDRWGVPIW